MRPVPDVMRAELGLEADQAARRNHVVEAHAALAVRMHAGQLAAALAERLHDRALRAFVEVDGQRFVRLARLAFDFLDDHARPRDRELVAFAAHVLEQHAEVQLAAAEDPELVGIVGLLDAQRDVVHAPRAAGARGSGGW